MIANNQKSSESEPYLGPHGLGDPADTKLRKVELEVLIPKKMREKAKAEKCDSEVAEFMSCAKENGISMVVKCQVQNSKMKECLTKWYRDEGFKKICTEEYLKERSDYRRTGIGQKVKDNKL